MKKTYLAIIEHVSFFSCVAFADLSDNGVQESLSINGDYVLRVLIISIVSIIIFLLLFYLLREVICWYFKINRIVYLLEELNDNIYDMRRKKEVDSDESKYK